MRLRSRIVAGEDLRNAIFGQGMIGQERKKKRETCDTEKTFGPDPRLLEHFQ